MRPGRVAAIVFGALGVLVGIGALGAGAVAVWAHSTQRDAAGFYVSPTDHLSTSGYAVAADVDFGGRPSSRDWTLTRFVDAVRVQATASSGVPVFIGIAPTSEANLFLAQVPYSHVTSISVGPLTTTTEAVAGSRPAAVPTTWGHWAASVVGSGTQHLTWNTQSGHWSVVVMNADARRGVDVDVKVGAKTGLLLPIGAGLLAFGFVSLLGAAFLILFGMRGVAREAAQAGEEAPSVPTHPEGAPGSYPVRLDGHLDPSVSRWQWLFKWLLVIPHVFILAFLWIAVSVLTVVAGVTILFTGRYPRSIFDFNVGVMRWSWRVAFYAIGAFGTDRYHPFSLHPDPGYPADFSVDYPARLSRGLVLVKWWLLAIPHYLVVAVFAGGWGFGWNGWRAAGGSGLIALLALIAAVILAVGGRYPESLFDFVMGMNRWCYRVLAYAALMRDEYPPFRLDTGGTDPGSVPVLPPPPGPVPGRQDELVGSAR